MNKSKLDNLFRAKLHDHKVAPRPEAWTKLKGNLDSDRKKVLLIYWRVAAIVILFLVSIFFIYQMKNAGSGIPIADKQEKVTPGVVDRNNAVLPGQEELVTGKAEIPATPSQNEKTYHENGDKPTTVKPGSQSLALKEPIRATKKVKEIKADDPETKLLKVQTGESLEILATGKSTGEVRTADIEAVKPITPRSFSDHETRDLASIAALDKHHENDGAIEKNDLPNITITFKKDESEILQEPVASNEELSKVKKFALKKVISLAKDIKAGEVGLSTLREKKDELLAFHFNKKKNVKNSK